MGRGKWLIDGMDLSGRAWNVSSRALGFSRAGLRGGNVVTPGVDGERWVPNKPMEALKIRLSMWAVGAERDGTMPTNRSRQVVCRDNLEWLASVLSDSSQLHELTRIETAGYGTVNLFPNPRSEDGATTLTGYHQWLTNPSQRIQAPLEIRRNLFPDPNLVNRGTPQTSVNLYPDPYHKRYRVSSTPQLYANHWAYVSYESSQGFTVGGAATGWVEASGTNATVSDWGTRGRQGMQLKATSSWAAGKTIGRREDAAFPQGKQMSFRVYVRRLNYSTTTRNLQARAVWYDGSGNQVGTSPWSSSQPVPSGQQWGWITLPASVAGTSPSSRASVELRTVEAVSSGDGYLFDQFGMFDGGLLTNEAAPYFDGDDPWAEWNSTAGRSRAWVSGCVDPQWVPGTANAFYAYAASTQSGYFGTSINFVAHRQLPGGSQTFTRDLPAASIDGRPYTLRFSAQALKGTASLVELCTRENGVLTSRGTVVVTGLAPATFWSESSGLEGLIYDYVGPTWTPTAGQTLVVRVTVPVQSTGNAVLQLTALGVTDHDAVRAGSDAASTFATYTWQGTAYQSPTTITKPTSPFVDTRHSFDQIGTAPALACYVRSATENPRLRMPTVAVTPVMRTAGIAVLAQVRSVNRYGSNQAQVQPSVRWVITGMDDSGATTQTWTGATVALPLAAASGAGGTMVPVHLGVFDISPGTTQWRAQLEYVTPVVGQYLQAQRVVLSDHFISPEAGWFATGFVGTVNNSATALSSPAPVGWHADIGTVVTQAAGALTITAVSVPARPPAISVDVARPAGVYLVGFSVSATRRGQVVVDALSGGVVVGSAPIGRAVGSPTAVADQMQGVLGATAPFDQVRIRIVPDPTAAASLWMTVGAGYVISLSESHLPAVEANLVSNPTAAQGILGWMSPVDNPTTVTTTVVRGRMFSTNAGKLVQDRTFPVATVAHLRVWARVLTDSPAAVRIHWFDGAGVELAPTTVSSDDASSRDRVLYGTATVPASATSATVEVRNVSGVGTLAVLGVYAAPEADGRDFGANVTPTRWLGFDGSSRSDSTGTEVGWDGAADASTSSTHPAVPSGWEANGLVRLQETLIRPPGSTGRVVGFPGFDNVTTPVPTNSGQFGGFLSGFTAAPSDELPDLPDQTLVGRTVAMATPDPFVSGEVALARSSLSSQVTVRLYGCDDEAKTNPTLQFQKRLQTLADVVTWRDVGTGQAFCYLEVEYVETEPNLGYAVTVDNVMVLNTAAQLAGDYPPYFDGSSPSATWLGVADQSASKNYAGARHCFAEFPEPIDPDSMAGATRAEFTATGLVPDAVWSDLIESTFTADVTDPDVDLPVTTLAGSSARNGTCLITVALTLGTAPESIVLTDSKSESWVQIGYQLQPGEVIRVDCGAGTVTVVRDGDEDSLASVTSRGGTSRLLVLTPFSTTLPPTLNVASADEFDGTLHVEVTGRKKYVIA